MRRGVEGSDAGELDEEGWGVKRRLVERLVLGRVLVRVRVRVLGLRLWLWQGVLAGWSALSSSLSSFSSSLEGQQTMRVP